MRDHEGRPAVSSSLVADVSEHAKDRVELLGEGVRDTQSDSEALR